jgi:hypothetical protein
VGPWQWVVHLLFLVLLPKYAMSPQKILQHTGVVWGGGEGRAVRCAVILQSLARVSPTATAWD